MKLGIVILAAGASSRLGEPKQLLAFAGKTLLQHTIDTAFSVSDGPVVVVLGGHEGKIRPLLDATRVRLATNPDWAAGMGGSIRVGLENLLEFKIDAALFLVCDQPRLTPAILRRLLLAFEASGSALVASEYGEKLGVPALFGQRLFPELLALRGVEGARKVIERHRLEAIGVPFPGGAEDIDTPRDVARFLQIPEKNVVSLPD